MVWSGSVGANPVVVRPKKVRVCRPDEFRGPSQVEPLRMCGAVPVNELVQAPVLAGAHEDPLTPNQ